MDGEVNEGGGELVVGIGQGDWPGVFRVPRVVVAVVVGVLALGWEQ